MGAVSQGEMGDDAEVLVEAVALQAMPELPKEAGHHLVLEESTPPDSTAAHFHVALLH